MTLRIWVDDWQMQCCGEGFAPGDVVSWALLEVDPEDYADILGSEPAAEVDFREEHHGQEEGRAPTSMEVVSVVEVHCRYEVPPGATDKVNYPFRARPCWYRSRRRTGGRRAGRMSASRATW
ncbi:DUF6578 domain-containing protein [Streptomyces sp. NPDC090301]|uniref:DUF6578 domain-containing protein n=1 Tax=Streptomyces sp. NPDC090301 TaxID=3154975 RepID=UPI003421FE22